jgi:hypothetical protein
MPVTESRWIATTSVGLKVVGALFLAIMLYLSVLSNPDSLNPGFAFAVTGFALLLDGYTVDWVDSLSGDEFDWKRNMLPPLLAMNLGASVGIFEGLSSSSLPSIIGVLLFFLGMLAVFNQLFRVQDI